MRKREISKRLQEHPEWRRLLRASQPAATQANTAAGSQPTGQPSAPATADDSMGGQPASQPEPASNDVDARIEALEATLKFFTTEAAQLQSTFGLDLYKLKLDAAQADLREARERRKQRKPLHLRVKNADHDVKMYAGRQQRAVAALEQLEKHHADLVAAHVKAIAALDKQREEKHKVVQETSGEHAKSKELYARLLAEQTLAAGGTATACASIPAGSIAPVAMRPVMVTADEAMLIQQVLQQIGDSALPAGIAQSFVHAINTCYTKPAEAPVAAAVPTAGAAAISIAKPGDVSEMSKVLGDKGTGKGKPERLEPYEQPLLGDTRSDV